MSCVDSAIIKALVDHIGMNPDDVPVGSHQCVTYTAGTGIHISADNVISSTVQAGSGDSSGDTADIFDTTKCTKLDIVTKHDETGMTIAYNPSITRVKLGDIVVFQQVSDGSTIRCFIVEIITGTELTLAYYINGRIQFTKFLYEAGVGFTNAYLNTSSIAPFTDSTGFFSSNVLPNNATFLECFFAAYVERQKYNASKLRTLEDGLKSLMNSA